MPSILKFLFITFCALIITTAAHAQFDGGAGPAAPPQPTITAKPRRAQHWWERRSPAKDNAADQLAYADALMADGQTSAAARHYRILTFAWPNSSEAPVAQFKYADILYQRQKYSKAFDEYQYLLDTYAGFCPYDTVLERQYAIANTVATRRKRLLFVSYQDEEEAIPMFEQLIANAPTWHRASEMQFRIARIHEKNGEYDLALDAYAAFQQRFPMSPQAEAAFYGHARCWYLYARRHPNDTSLREQAANAQQLFLNTYPRSPTVETVRAQYQELRVEQAGFLYQQARLYDTMASHTRVPREKDTLLTASRISYQRLLREFPDSRWSDMASARINQIEHRQPAVLEKP